MWALLLFPAALVALSAAPVARTAPRRAGSSLVAVTERKVLWRLHPKTGKPQYRTEIAELPAELASALAVKLGHPVKPETYVLAALVASEAGSQVPLAKAAVAHAARNMARRKKVTLGKLLVPDGRLGSQHGRYASTRRAPTREDLDIAEAVLTGKVRDPAGAVQWDSPAAYERLAARGEPGYERSVDEVARARIAAGRRLVTLPGVDPRELRLWA